MEPQTARVIMEFMKRVDLKGNEAMTFTQCMAALELAASPPPPAPVPDKPEKK